MSLLLLALLLLLNRQQLLQPPVVVLLNGRLHLVQLHRAIIGGGGGGGGGANQAAEGVAGQADQRHQQREVPRPAVLDEDGIEKRSSRRAEEQRPRETWHKVVGDAAEQRQGAVGEQAAAQVAPTGHLPAEI